MTTNEYTKHGGLKQFLNRKSEFLKRWEDARLARKPFKPSAKAIASYIVNNDIQVDMSDADLTKIRRFTQSRAEKINRGSHFPSKSLLHAFARIWDPDAHDVDGNTEMDTSLEKPAKA